MSRKSFHTIAMAVTALVLPPLAACALEPSKSDQPEDVIISRVNPCSEALGLHEGMAALEFVAALRCAIAA